MQVRRAVGEGNSLLLVLLVMLVFVPFPGFLISIKLVTIPDSPIFNPKCYVAPMHHERSAVWVVYVPSGRARVSPGAGALFASPRATGYYQFIVLLLEITQKA